MSFIELCRKFIGIDSSPSRGTREISEYAAELCRSIGLHVELQYETHNGLHQANLIARRTSQPQENEVLFQSHLDTVDPGHFSNWEKTQYNPFSASIQDGKIIGLGVADCKLDFLCKLEAIKSATLSQKNTFPFVLVGTYGAFSGMDGAVKLLRRKKVLSKKGLIGEPTQLHLGNASQGFAEMEIIIPFSEEETLYRRQHDLQESSSTQSKIFTQKPNSYSTNGSREIHNLNPIVKLLHYLSQLPESIAVMDIDGGTHRRIMPSSAVLEIDVVGNFKNPILPKIAHVTCAIEKMERHLKEFTTPGFDPPHPTINIGVVKTHSDHIRLEGSCRLPPLILENDLFPPLIDQYERWLTDLKNECTKVGALFKVNDYKSAFQTSPRSEFMQKLQDCQNAFGKTRPIQPVPAITEASVFNRFGIECVLVGPGQGVGNTHAANESIRIVDLDEAISFYQKVLEGPCL
ncbi:MAG: M20/M25/M40 family metallo-hydrolase [Bdellovibrionales bacterium]|nr:M20/M25/M40 family metallo-hydrolase [Bdellovibrionales bacterium]